MFMLLLLLFMVKLSMAEKLSTTAAWPTISHKLWTFFFLSSLVVATIITIAILSIRHANHSRTFRWRDPDEEGDEDEQRWDAASLSFRPAIRGSAEALGHTVHHINRNDNCIIGSMIGFHSILTYIFMYKGLKFAALFFTVALLPEAVVPALI